MEFEVRFVAPGSYFIVRPNGARIGPYSRRIDAILDAARMQSGPEIDLEADRGPDRRNAAA